jgi:transposase-like protein
MSTPNLGNTLRSSPVWAGVQEWLQEQVQGLLQEALEQEVTEALGRLKSQRRGGRGGAYRNGHGRQESKTTYTTCRQKRRGRVRWTSPTRRREAG